MADLEGTDEEVLKRILAAQDDADTIAALRRENEEQARLLGASGSREAALLARVDELRREVEKLEKIRLAAQTYVEDSYRPTPKYDARRFDALCDALGYAREGGNE